jgi:hypothetical protein
MVSNTSIEADSEARRALWMAICDAGRKLAGRCSIYISHSAESRTKIHSDMQVPEVKAWKLVEALSLLAILIRADEVHSREVLNLFGQTGPLHFVEEGHDRYLWAKPPLAGQESALGSRPDLIVASSQDKPSAATVLRVVECKCRKRLSAQDIRAEFGKAHDLRVTSYLIWSFTTPSGSLVEGARRLGLDLVALGFDTPFRSKLIAEPEILVAHVANTVAVSRKEAHFGRMLLISSEDISKKMLEIQ